MQRPNPVQPRIPPNRPLFLPHTRFLMVLMNALVYSGSQVNSEIMFVNTPKPSALISISLISIYLISG